MAIALTSGLAIVGTGFSVFYYVQGAEANVGGEGGIPVSLAKATTGTFQIALGTDSTLVFDSTRSAAFKKRPAISWEDKEGLETGIDGHFLHVQLKFDPQGGTKTSIDFVGMVSVKITFPQGLFKYVLLDKSLTSEIGSEWQDTTDKDTWSMTSIAIYSADSALTIDTNGKWLNVPFPLAYQTKDVDSVSGEVTTWEPSTEEEWEALYAFNGEKITVEVSTQEETGVTA